MHSNLELFGISLITGASFLLVPSVAAAQSAPVAQSEAVTKYAAASPKQKPGRVKKDNPTQQLKKDNPTQQPESVKKDNPTQQLKKDNPTQQPESVKKDNPT